MCNIYTIWHWQWWHRKHLIFIVYQGFSHGSAVVSSYFTVLCPSFLVIYWSSTMICRSCAIICCSFTITCRRCTIIGRSSAMLCRSPGYLHIYIKMFSSWIHFISSMVNMCFVLDFPLLQYIVTNGHYWCLHNEYSTMCSTVIIIRTANDKDHEQWRKEYSPGIQFYYWKSIGLSFAVWQLILNR